MRKYTLLVSCMLMIAPLALLAQTHQQKRSKAEWIFSVPELDIHNTHNVHLDNDASMIIETADVTDLLMLRNMDSLVGQIWQDIAFYKDSVGPLENVRIDYVLKLESDKTMMRFRKYAPDGDIYVKMHGEFSRMKVERDTVRLIIRKPLHDHSSHMFFYDYPVQVTFLFNNYSAMGDLLKKKGALNQIVDTLTSVTLPKVYDPNIARHETVVDYYPFTSGKTLHIRHLDEGGDESDSRKKKDKLVRN